MVQTLIVILITLLFSAFFSGMEIAFVASNKLQIELDRKRERFPSRIIAKFMQNTPRYIATMLVGNNIALVIYGLVMASLLDPYIGKFTNSEITILTVQTIVSTLIILITAEFLPKTLFRSNANGALNIFAIPVNFFYYLFAPLTRFTIFLSNRILRRIFKEPVEHQQTLVFGKVDLDDFVRESQEATASNQAIKHEMKFFQNALQFSQVKVRECIIPRPEIVAIDVTESIQNLKKAFIETGFSKILVYRETIDNIIGYFHSSDLFHQPETIDSKLNELSIVPETMQAKKILAKFIQEHKSIALVVDEYGGTAGIVTIEDIIEEIFGEIEDEHDSSALVEHELGVGEYQFSARLEIDYLNGKYHLGLPDSDDYETLAGFILDYYTSLPQVNEIITIGHFVFEILKMTDTRIDLVKLRVKPKF